MSIGHKTLGKIPMVLWWEDGGTNMYMYSIYI